MLKKNIKDMFVGAIVGAVAVGGVWIGIIKTPGKTIATFGNTEITSKELNQNATAVAGSQVLTQMIADGLIINEAQKEKINITQTQINQDISAIEKQNNISSKSQLISELKKQGTTEQTFQRNIKISLMEKAIAERKISITNTEIQSYKKSNKGTKLSNAQIKNLLINQKLESPSQLVSDLAKAEKLKITDAKYQYLLSSLEIATSTTKK